MAVDAVPDDLTLHGVYYCISLGGIGFYFCLIPLCLCDESGSVGVSHFRNLEYQVISPLWSLPSATFSVLSAAIVVSVSVITAPVVSTAAIVVRIGWGIILALWLRSRMFLPFVLVGYLSHTTCTDRQ
ncbi:unnamed protein product [Rodentolepis nana]|uniref:AA_permease domain-containing protein n=1 Tax=Rodentolepis nana TaxID=102285 RepID=A0A0R3T904_RODNA|nr:unnamed protein product [Rodentolepis nana]